MGEVYRARDERLGRTVAVKVLNPEVAARQEARARFEREARAASALGHPAVAHVYEMGDASGRWFIAMEFVEGERLDRKIGGRPLPLETAVDIGIAVADALDAAHAKGIIHRDIKPANVIVSPRGQVKVLDFGLARLEPTAAATDVTVAGSEPGLILGTVQYMSPEQALGRSVDARSDLFSLGVVLYEMATGRLPFAGLTTTETIERIVHAQPEAVSRFNYGVPPGLEHIIRKCLEKDPDRRYQSARELLVDLRNLSRDSADGRPVGVGPARPRRRLAVLVAAGLAGALALAWLGWSRWTGGTGFDAVAVLPFAFASADQDIEYLADGLTETLINNLSRVPDLRVVPRGVAFRYKGREADPRAVARELNVKALVTGRVTARAGTLTVQAELIEAASLSQLWGQQYERVSDVLALQGQVTDAIVQRLRPAPTRPEDRRAAGRETTDNEAFQLYLKGRHHWNKRTEDGFRRALESFTQAIDRDPTYAKAYAGTADCYSLLARYQFVAPREGFPLARAAALKALELDDTVAEVHNSLAYVATNYDRDWATAEREFKRAIELDPTYATAHHWYGLFLAIRGDLDAAIRSATEARRLDPLSLIINTNLGRMYYYAGQHDQAIESHRKALDLDPHFGEGLLRLGWVYDRQGRYDLAIDVLSRATATPGLSGANGALGHALARAGRTTEARATLRQLEAVARRRYVDAYDLALVHIGLGQVDEAFAALTRAANDRSGMVVYARVDPLLEPLRRDARFDILLASMGLGQR